MASTGTDDEKMMGLEWGDPHVRFRRLWRSRGGVEDSVSGSRQFDDDEGADCGRISNAGCRHVLVPKNCSSSLSSSWNESIS